MNQTRQVIIWVILSGIILASALFSPTIVYAQAGTIRVAPTGTDTFGCGSEQTPCRTIQFAVDQVARNSVATILVAAGTYTYANASLDNLCFTSTIKPSVVCFVDKFLTIRGGYNASDWKVSDPVLNPTIIDGQNQYRGVSVLGTSGTTVKASLVMEGFVIRNGLAQGASSGADYQIGGYGGGLFANQASVTLRNIVFRNNRAVGGNTSLSYGGVGTGGGLVINGAPSSATSTLYHVTFDGNQAVGGTGTNRGGAAFGGGFYTYNSIVNGTYITFTNNIAMAGSSSGSGQDATGTADGLGGGAAIHVDAIAFFRYLVATGNQAIGGNASLHGGHGHGGAVFAEDARNLSIVSSTMKGNIARGGNAATGGVGGGGAVIIDRTPTTIETTSIISNTAKGGTGTTIRGPVGGGGIYAIRFSGNSTISILNSVIADNYIERGDGAGDPGGGGGGLWLQGVQIDIVHSTIAGNRMESALVYGSGALFVNYGTPTGTTANIRYSIISDHPDTNPSWIVQAALHAVPGNTVNLYRGLFAGNSKDTNADGMPDTPGTFNGLDTMLSALSAKYFSPGSPHYNYHLSALSPAKDQASGSTTTVDLDNENRPYNSAADIGADEHQPFKLQVIPGNQSLALDWSSAASILAGAVYRYDIIVTCPPGANPPAEGNCGQAINAGTTTSFRLTGLSNFMAYTIGVNALDANNSTLLSSQSVTASPTNIFLYLPLVLK